MNFKQTPDPNPPPSTTRCFEAPIKVRNNSAVSNITFHTTPKYIHAGLE